MDAEGTDQGETVFDTRRRWLHTDRGRWAGADPLVPLSGGAALMVLAGIGQP